MQFRLTSRVSLALVLAGISTASSAQSQATMPPATLNPSQGYTVPAPRVAPVSPANPNTSPGSTLGSSGTNPVTGQPCVGTGSSATTNGTTTPPGFGSSGVIGAC